MTMTSFFYIMMSIRLSRLRFRYQMTPITKLNICPLYTNYNFLCIPAFPCPALTAPMHGILACNGWRTDFDNICRVSCLHGYTHPASVHPDTLYVCGATGNWMPAIAFDKCTPIGDNFRPPLDALKSK